MAAGSRAECVADSEAVCAVALAEVGMAVSGAVDMVVVEATGNQIVESILKEEKLNGGK